MNHLENHPLEKSPDIPREKPERVGENSRQVSVVLLNEVKHLGWWGVTPQKHRSEVYPE